MISAHPDIACLVARIEPDIVTWRRHLHAQPELSFKEFETSGFVAERLRSFGGIEVSHVSETGVMGRLRGTSTGPTIALRADIDALPIQEENTFDFVSGAEGVMHACGHDGHTAVLLGVARILADMRDEIPGEIRFIFQHAEELPPGGARDFIAAGAMDGVDYVIGCHLLDDRERPGGGDGRPSNGGRRHVLAHHPRQGRARGVPARDDRPDRDHVPGDHQPPARRRPRD